jgi:hypothetical protein
MRSPQKTLVAVLAALTLLAAATRARAGDSVEPKARAHELVEGQQSTIALLMHPTATLKSISCERTRTLDNGDFTMEYTFRFRAWYGKSFYSKMHFRFYANGGLDSCSGGETSAWVRPFTASNWIVGWFRNRLASNAGKGDNDQLRRLLDQSDASTLLEWWLKSAQ